MGTKTKAETVSAGVKTALASADAETLRNAGWTLIASQNLLGLILAVEPGAIGGTYIYPSMLKEFVEG